MCTTKKFGTAGELSNKIQFIRTTADGNWILTEDVTITAVVRRSSTRGGASRLEKDTGWVDIELKKEENNGRNK